MNKPTNDNELPTPSEEWREAAKIAENVYNQLMEKGHTHDIALGFILIVGIEMANKVNGGCSGKCN